MRDAPTTRISLLAKLSDRNDLLAWQEFVRLYEPAIQRLAVRRGLQDADARELAQDVLLSVARLAESRGLAEVKSFRAWLATATRNRLVDRFRSRRNALSIQNFSAAQFTDTDHPATIESQWEIELRREIFAQASRLVQSQIPAQQWQAFWQTAIETRPTAEVATQLGMSIGHVYVARCRVIERLRKAVEQIVASESQS